MPGKQEEGYIKFQCDWDERSGPTVAEVALVNEYRRKLYEQHLIGELPDGIGFGNLSIRLPGNRILISGSGTGGNEYLTVAHYAIVTKYSIPENRVSCYGEVPASSETLSHAAVYEGAPQAMAVIHVHHNALWQNLLDKELTTDPKAAYGTVGMATSVKKLAQSAPEQGMIIMKGHEDGIISYGKDLYHAYNILMNHMTFSN